MTRQIRKSAALPDRPGAGHAATIPLLPPDAAAFAPFGQFVVPPDAPGARRFYSDAFAGAPADTVPVIHVNHVHHRVLPFAIGQIERHPHAAQCFVPLDVLRYAVVVLPSDPNGDPDPAGALGFVVPGTMGVIYAPGVWHLGATVLDRDGSFVVTMWRDGAQADDEFRDISPLTLIAAPPNRKTVHDPAQD